MTPTNNTFTQLTNVANGEGLEDAEAYLRGAALSFTAEGDPQAVNHWENLHRNPQRVPGLLNRYEDSMPNVFDKILKEQLKGDIDFKKLDYTNTTYICAIRKTFALFADAYSKSDKIYVRKLCTSIRLYARLPLWKRGSTEPAFYPAALLPSKWVAALSAPITGGCRYGSWMVRR